MALFTATVSCGQVVRYTDEISDPRSGRSFFVTAPAGAGGFVGFVLGLPVDLIALPATFTVYQVQKAQDPLRADPISTMLFPSFVLWRAGSLIAAPFDVLELVFYRAWRDPVSLTEEEREALEDEIDGATLPRYPVESIYPPRAPDG